MSGYPPKSGSTHDQVPMRQPKDGLLRALADKDAEIKRLRSLIARYIALVEMSEGTNFLYPWSVTIGDTELTADDQAELRRIRDETEGLP